MLNPHFLIGWLVCSPTSKKKKTTTSNQLLRPPLIFRAQYKVCVTIFPQQGKEGLMFWTTYLSKALPPLKIHSELPSLTPLHNCWQPSHFGCWEIVLSWSPWEKLLPTWQWWMAAPQGARRHKHKRCLQGLGLKSSQTIIKQHESEHWRLERSTAWTDFTSFWRREEFRSLYGFSASNGSSYLQGSLIYSRLWPHEKLLMPR